MKILLENWKKFSEAEEVSTPDTSAVAQPVIQFPDWLKGKLQDVHGKPGQGSVFAISIDEVVKKVQEVLANTKDIEKIANSTGTVSVNVPGIGYDLVVPKEQAMKLPDAKLGTVEKQEGPAKIAVPSVTTSAPISNFKSDQLTIIVRPMKDDAGNPKPNQFIILSAFPGNPSIPRASEWGDKFAVVIPSASLKENFYKNMEHKNMKVSKNELKKLISEELTKVMQEMDHSEHSQEQVDCKHCGGTGKVSVKQEGLIDKLFGNKKTRPDAVQDPKNAAVRGAEQRAAATRGNVSSDHAEAEADRESKLANMGHQPTRERPVGTQTVSPQHRAMANQMNARQAEMDARAYYDSYKE
jgi:hypothetical protein